MPLRAPGNSGVLGRVVTGTGTALVIIGLPQSMIIEVSRACRASMAAGASLGRVLCPDRRDRRGFHPAQLPNLTNRRYRHRCRHGAVPLGGHQLDLERSNPAAGWTYQRLLICTPSGYRLAIDGPNE